MFDYDLEKRKLANDFALKRLNREDYELELQSLADKKSALDALNLKLQNGEINSKIYNAQVATLLASKKSKSEAKNEQIAKIEEKNRSRNLFNTSLIVIILAFVVFLVAYAILHVRFIDSHTIRLSAGESPLSEPVQAELSGSLEKSVYGTKFNLNIRASYFIDATVEDIDIRANIASDRDKISPFTLKLRWSENCKKSSSIIVSALEGNQCSAKTHIIPRDNDIYNLISRLQVGDTIRLTGFLVDVYNDTTPVFISSLTRSDTYLEYVAGHSPIYGSAADQVSDEGEVLYITSLNWLKSY